MCDRIKAASAEDFDNVDAPIFYNRKFDEYGLKIMDGGSSFITITFCPWCGVKLPDSKRDAWFDELESLGIRDPWNEPIPDKYQTDAWYKHQTL